VVNVMFLIVPSLKEPVAVNCCVLPTVTLGVAGVSPARPMFGPTLKSRYRSARCVCGKLLLCHSSFRARGPSCEWKQYSLEDFQLNSAQVRGGAPVAESPRSCELQRCALRDSCVGRLMAIKARCAVETVTEWTR